MRRWLINCWSNFIRRPIFIGGLVFGTCLVLLCTRASTALEVDRTVVLVRANGYAGFLSRLTAELKIAGFQVRERSYFVVPAENQIETALRMDSAFLFVRELTRTVELYYHTSDGRMIHLNVPLPLSAEEEEVTTLHIVEVLRVAFPAAEPKEPMPSKESRPRTAQRGTDRLVSYLGAGAMFDSFSKVPQMSLRLGAGGQFLPWLSAMVEGTLPLRGFVLREPEGNIKLSCSAVGVAFQSVWGHSRVRPILRAGYRVWFVRASVSPEDGYIASARTVVTSGPVGYVGLAFLTVSRLGVDLGIYVAPTVSKLNFQADDRSMADLGRPLFGISLGVMLLAKESTK